MVFVKTESPAETFTLVHLSDFHLCLTAGAPPGAFAGKRLLSYLSWRLHRGQVHRPGILSEACRAVRRMNADQVVVTGDLTHLGLPAEFRRARSWLQALGPAERVFAVPGNHDALVAEQPLDTFHHWGEYMAGDSGAPSGDALHPALRRRGPLALIGVSTARPSLPFQAVGRIGPRQLERVSDLLRRAGRERLLRVVLIHHPPLEQAAAGHKRLQDAAAFRAVVQRAGAELILHGHGHRRTRFELPGPEGPVPVLGVSAASAGSRAIDRRAAIRVFRISGPPGARRTTVQDHVYEPDAAGFEPRAEEAL
jgi:3',5'-cyclic AMP phosphodiesterase CpdA